MLFSNRHRSPVRALFVSFGLSLVLYHTKLMALIQVWQRYPPDLDLATDPPEAVRDLYVPHKLLATSVLLVMMPDISNGSDKKNLLKMLNDLEKKIASNKKTHNLGKQFGTKLLDTYGTRKVLKSGKKVLELKCSPSSLLTSKLKKSRSFVWERKTPDMSRFTPIVGVSESGKLFWSEQTHWPKWIKYNEMLSIQSADGNVESPSKSFLKLYIPLGDCEDEAGSFKCKFYGEEKEPGVMKLEKYFKFKDKIDSKCTKSKNVAAAMQKMKSAAAHANPIAPGKPTASGKAVSKLGTNVDKVLDTVNPSLSQIQPVYYHMLAILETLIIFLLTIIIIVLCCCLRRKKKDGGSRTKSSSQAASSAPATQTTAPTTAPPAEPYSAPPTTGPPLGPPADAPPPPGPPPGAPARGALLGDINKLRMD